jgi:N-acetylmuramoyl-L-alanine amidase
MRRLAFPGCLVLCLLTVVSCGRSNHASSRAPSTEPEITLGGADETAPARTSPQQGSASSASTAPKATGPARPPTVKDFIPFGAKRKQETAAYAERHYGLDTYRLIRPRVIVEHYTVTPDFQSTYNTFAADVPDSELHELPATCAHFVIDRDGTIHQLVPLGIICRHTVGLNWTAIGIEHVGMSDQQVMSDKSQLDASLALTAWLRCHYGIAVRNVIGHAESLSSPYHREDVPSLRTQTHADMQPAAMDVYRRKLAEFPCSD